MLIYPFTGRFIKFLGGTMRCIMLGILATFIRLIVASYSTQYYQIILIQGINGMAITLSWSAIMEHTWTIFPKEITTIAVNIIWVINGTIPGLVARIAGGYIYQYIGGAKLFRIMAMILGSWLIFMIFYYEILSKKKSIHDGGDEKDKEKYDIELQLESKVIEKENDVTEENSDDKLEIETCKVNDAIDDEALDDNEKDTNIDESQDENNEKEIETKLELEVVESINNLAEEVGKENTGFHDETLESENESKDTTINVENVESEIKDEKATIDDEITTEPKLSIHDDAVKDPQC